MTTKLPINLDPALPSYECDEYRAMAGKWAMLQKVFDGPDFDRQDEFKRYLPQEPEEPPAAYSNRLSASVLLWENRFAEIVEDFAAILSNTQLSDDCPPSLLAAIEDIDQCGTSLNTYVQGLNKSVNMFGGVFILVEYPPALNADSALGESVRSPYLVAYDPLDVINWSFEFVGGRPVLEFAVIRQTLAEPVGSYGSELVTRYRVLRPGSSELWAVEEGRDGIPVARLVEGTAEAPNPAIVSDRSGIELAEIPLVYYPATQSKGMVSAAPLQFAAYLNLHLWQVESDRHNVMHKCNLPTPTIADKEKVGMDGNPINQKLVLGPNTFLSLSEVGKSWFTEPSGAALAATKEKAADVRESINRQGLNFLFGQNSTTATQSNLQATGTQACIKGMARLLNSVLGEIKGYWCAFTLEEPTGIIAVDDSLLQMAINPDQARLVVELMDQGRLTYATGMAILQRGKIIPESVDLAEEEAALEAIRGALPIPSAIAGIAGSNQSISAGARP